MLDVLCPLITESDNVSPELLDIILINIVEPNKSSKKNAYHLAKDLIVKTSETLEQYVQQVSAHADAIIFFSEFSFGFLVTTMALFSFAVFQSSPCYGQGE